MVSLKSILQMHTLLLMFIDRKFQQIGGVQHSATDYSGGAPITFDRRRGKNIGGSGLF
jgi:hypothetical protein